LRAWKAVGASTHAEATGNVVSSPRYRDRHAYVRHDACVGVASKYCSPTPGRSKYSGVKELVCTVVKVEDVTRPLPPLCATVALRL